MRTLTRRIAVPVAIVMAMSTAPLLAGCFGQPVQGIVSGATGGKVDVGGKTIPSDFPKAVPLYKGSVLSVASIGGETDKTFNIGIAVPGPAAMAEIETELKAAGFTPEVEGNIGKIGGSLVATSKKYGVGVLLARTGKGYQANYTVSPVDQAN